MTGASTDRSGGVVWITGLSGSGKSALARRVVAALRGGGRCAVLLDGDQLRAALAQPGHDLAARTQLAMQYVELAWLLATQGLVVVVATVSLLHAVHARNRSHEGRYLEVLLETEEAIRAARCGDRGGGPRVGVEIAPQFPRAPHLVLRNDAQPATLDALAERIVQELDR